MRRAIERTGWRGAVIGSERGEQARANIEKLLEMAREFEERGFTNLFDFVERITELIEAEEVESEAPVNTGRDAVRLMTMHGAKGLEFPIVVLPSLHSKAGGSSRFYFDKELGFGWNWSFNKTEFRPAVVGLMNVRGQWKDRAEEARLFYVAATRARDMLILSGEYNSQKPPRDTMLNWGLAPLHDLLAEEEPGDLSGNRSVPLFSPALRFLNPDGATERVEPWEQMIDIHRKIADLPKYAPYLAEPLPFRADLVRIGELPTRAEGEIYSASQFLVYSQCPTKYYLKYRLGIPEEFNSVYQVDPNGRDAGEDGTIFARLFRGAAAKIDLTPGLSASPSPLTERGEDEGDTGSRDTALGTLRKLSSVQETRTIGEIIEEVLLLEPLAEEQLETLRPRLLETFERILASPAATAALFPPGATSSVEQELRLPFDHDFVMGVMDRMLVDGEGTISLLHYKTLRLDRENLARVAEGYLPQLRLYAYLVSALNPAQRSIRATLLFTEHPDAPQSFTFTKFDMIRIEEELRAAIADIRQITYTGRRELPLRTAHCPLCPYYVREHCMLESR
jgi:hypothetical protein